jgi:putative SOS response-associated peptidase YedK
LNGSTEEKKKIPWYISFYNDGIMSLAGLWDEWVESSTGERFSTFTVVTTDANELMAEIHNSKKRMPVILDPDMEQNWLNLDLGEQNSIDLLKPCPSDILNAYTISDLINRKSSDKNIPDIIKPFNRDTGGSLF